MSQSMSNVENWIFAFAPLGIITAMVAATRVGGPRRLRAIIGRARESRAVVEVELMSSTSADVCELWNGDAVVRVLGSSPVIELYYLEPGCVRKTSTNVQPQGKRDYGIWNLEEAVSAGLLEGSGPFRRHLGLEGGPNMGLNLSDRRVSSTEYYLVATIGFVLQAGVIVFAGVEVYLPIWKKRFEKGGKEYPKYALPLMAVGTVTLVFGMFFCCLIVERSTTEDTWAVRKPNKVIKEESKDKVRVAWLQKGGEVNDQHFKSYILHRNEKSSDKQLHVRSSRREVPPKDRRIQTTGAVIASLVGFVAQFLGLRALPWQVTIAQLVATGFMTALRAWVRRNLVHEPAAQVTESGHELDAMAMKITGCSQWNVTAKPSDPEGGLGAVPGPHADEPTPSADEPTPPAGSDRFKLAEEAMDARRRLGSLSGWSPGYQKTAETVAQAIEASLDFLWANPDVKLLAKDPPLERFESKLFVEIPDAASGGNGIISTTVKLNLSRKGALGYWKADKGEIEAVLGLWMLHLKKLQPTPGIPASNGEREGEDDQGMGISETYRNVGSGRPSSKMIYKKWLLPQTELAITSAGDIVGISNPHGTQCLAVLSETPLERICGQQIYSTVLANAVNGEVDSIIGKVLVGGSQEIRDSFRLSNSVIDGVLEKVVQAGLASTEDALLSIVPALVGKYSIENAATTETFSALEKEISTYLNAGKFEPAEVLLLWLLHAAESAAKGYEEKEDWPAACKIYVLLFKTYYGIGSKNYARRADEAAGLFRERFHSFNQTRSEEERRESLNDMKKAIEEMQIGGRWVEMKGSEEALQSRGRDGYPAPTGMAGEELCSTAAYANDIVDAPGQPIDINRLDSMGRTPLVLACLSGNSNIAIQLLRRKADPCLKDRYRRTAVHYAALRNDTSVLHALFLHEKTGEVIDAHDRDGASPLALAIQNSSGAAIALLVFYGAQDPGESAKELLTLSTLRGSCAAVKVVSNPNDKDLEYGRTSLHWATLRGGEAAKLLDARNVEVEAQGKDGLTALHLAACCGCDSGVEFLIKELGADANARTGDGETALYLASARGHGSTVELLIQQLGADLTATTAAGKTALHGASAGGHVSTVMLLIQKHHVDVNAKTDGGETALHLASAGGHDSTVELLIRQLDADAHALTGNGETALHRACAGGHDSTAELLIQNLGADINAKTEVGETALHLASAGGHDSTVELLIMQLGADVHAITGSGQTALHRASAESHDSTVKLLIERCDADKNAETEDGQTALHFACGGGHGSTARLLIEKFDAERSHVDRNGRMALHLLVKYMYVP